MKLHARRDFHTFGHDALRVIVFLFAGGIDALMARRQAEGLPACAIQFGPWRALPERVAEIADDGFGRKRPELNVQRLVESKVFLELWVKVRKDWRARDHDLHELGYVEQE